MYIYILPFDFKSIGVSPRPSYNLIGIFHRLFSLLENSCNELDARVVLQDSADDGGPTFTRYVITLQLLRPMEEEAVR